MENTGIKVNLNWALGNVCATVLSAPVTLNPCPLSPLCDSHKCHCLALHKGNGGRKVSILSFHPSLPLVLVSPTPGRGSSFSGSSGSHPPQPPQKTWPTIMPSLPRSPPLASPPAPSTWPVDADKPRLCIDPLPSPMARLQGQQPGLPRPPIPRPEPMLQNL